LLRDAAPSAIVVPDARFTDNGRVCTSAGISAGIDLALHVVGRLRGQEAVDTTVREMDYERRA
jgi:transcriptional regulator GlxA family with amidase domain